MRDPIDTHIGENIGATATHVVFVELKETRPAASPLGALGPSDR
jgi:hypothetical protein